ncbi:MAG: hypothetical protein II634_03110, partial [Lachnospiraceae bacterium]|nr:hypothetical protein [Lachnospiraceae bacterium]
MAFGDRYKKQKLRWFSPEKSKTTAIFSNSSQIMPAGMSDNTSPTGEAGISSLPPIWRSRHKQSINPS